MEAAAGAGAFSGLPSAGEALQLLGCATAAAAIAATPPPIAALPSPSQLCFPHPLHFAANQLAMHVPAWEELLSGRGDGPRLLSWIADGVRVAEFWAPFKGAFEGRSYSSVSPPRFEGRNHASVAADLDFVRAEVAKGVASGAMRLVGAVGAVQAPQLVQPLGVVTTSKQRLIYDCRFGNLWCSFPSFAYDAVTMVPALVDADPSLTHALAFDHASGYHHVRLSAESTTYFGFELDGAYYEFLSLPFGWSPACFVYQALTRALCDFLSAATGAPHLAYLDDVFALVRGSMGAAVAYVTCVVMMHLGYFLQLPKCRLQPAARQQWLGFEVDIANRMFAVTAKKADTLRAACAGILAAGRVEALDLERLIGKLIALRVAVPGALLFVRQLYALLSAAQEAAPPSLRFAAGALLLSAGARRELQFWGGHLDPSNAFRRWRSTRHVTVVVYTDSSGTRWGGTVDCPPAGGIGEPLSIACGEVWGPADVAKHITAKEALAQPRVLACVPPQYLRGATVDLHTDASAVHNMNGGDRSLQEEGGYFLGHQGSSSADMNEAAIEMFDLQQELGFDVRSHWLSSAANWKADAFSRLSLLYEYMLSPLLWRVILAALGFPALDLMSSAPLTNSLPALPGTVSAPLPFISRLHVPRAAGVDIFRQQLERGGRLYYVHPPPPLVGSVIALLREQRALVIIVVVAPARGCSVLEAAWWDELRRRCISGDSLLLAKKGAPDAFRHVSKGGDWAPGPTLKQDLWAFKVDFGRQ